MQSSKSLKITKNSTFRVKPGILKGVCDRVFCECQSVNPRPRQAQEPCPALPQASPAESSQVRAQEPLPSCPKAQGECLVSRELSREVTRPRSPSQCPGMSSGQAQEKLLFQPIVPICPGLKNTCFLRPGKFRKTLS